MDDDQDDWFASKFVDEGPGVGFSQEEIDAAESLLRRLWKNKDVYQSSMCRDLRRAMVPFCQELVDKRAKSVAESVTAMKGRLLQARKVALQQQDKHLVNVTAMRRSRIAKLQTLLEEQPTIQQMIADGPVTAEEAAALLPATQALLTDAPAAILPALVETLGLSGSETAGATIGSDDSKAPEATGVPSVLPELVLGGLDPTELHRARQCYVCKARYTQLHSFYATMCPSCADLNWLKRNQSTDLTGYTALVTGCRVKIGYFTCLKLLRAGATVIGTSRFPTDAATRFQAESDSAVWSHRLHLYGIDLRDLAHLEEFCAHVERTFPTLDIIINNACQTVRRPAAYYRHLIHAELNLEGVPAAAVKLLEQGSAFEADFQARFQAAHGGGSGGAAMLEDLAHTVDAPEAKTEVVTQVAFGRPVPSALKSQLILLAEDVGHDTTLFPEGVRDVHGRQVDLRNHNSWLLQLPEVSTPELLETFTVNTIAPFIINSKLIPIMRRGPPKRRFVINVTAMEGKFYRHKTPNHPHTNMAKAALNMMTRTSAEELAKKDHIYMNSVDTGWVNDENPLDKAAAWATKSNFQTPIDEIDAAARILDPVMTGVSSAETPKCGTVWKDYHETEW